MWGCVLERLYAEGRVPRRDLADRLLAHRPPVVSTRGTYTYYDPFDTRMPGRPFKGVTRVINEWFLVRAAEPTPSGEAKRVRTLVREAHARTKRRPTPSVGSGLHGRMRGSTRGSYVHLQIADFVALTPEQFGAKYPHGMHPFATALMRAIRARGWWPLCAEYVVYHEGAGVATEIDLICLDETDGCLILIENKTGYGAGAFHAAGTRREVWRPGTVMARLGTRFPVTPCNKALVQQALGCLMLARNLGMTRADYRSFVAHVDDRQQPQFIEQVPVWLDTMLPALDVALTACAAAARA